MLGTVLPVQSGMQLSPNIIISGKHYWRDTLQRMSAPPNMRLAVGYSICSRTAVVPRRMSPTRTPARPACEPAATSTTTKQPSWLSAEQIRG